MISTNSPESELMRNVQTHSMPHMVWIDNTPLETRLHATRSLKVSSELRKLGWKVTLVYPGPAGSHDISGVEVYGIPWMDTYLIRQLSFNPGVFRFLLRNLSTIDIVIYHDMAAPWMLFCQFWVHHVLGRSRPLFVMDTRTLPMESRDTATKRDRIRGRYLMLMNSLANHLADGRTAITRRMAVSLAIPEERLWGIWTSGVDLEEFKKAGDTRKFPAAGEEIHIIYIGVMQYERNLMALCRAVLRARDEGMEFRLRLVGAGNEWDDLKKYSEQSGGTIEVHSPIPHDQVWKELSDAHIGVLPFPDEEKFRVSSPIKLFEYMASGLPVLATPVVCHTDVIKDGGYVFWTDGSDVDGLLAGIRHAWQAKDKLAGMGKLAKEAAKAWTWASSARKLQEALVQGINRNA